MSAQSLEPRIRCPFNFTPNVPTSRCPVHGTVPGIRRHVSKTHGLQRDERNRIVDAECAAQGIPLHARPAPRRRFTAVGATTGRLRNETVRTPIDPIPAHWAAHIGTPTLLAILRTKGADLDPKTTRLDVLDTASAVLDDTARQAALAAWASVV